MKKNYLLIISAATVLMFASCTSTYRTRTSKTMTIAGSGISHRPVIADLEVKDTKVTGMAAFAEQSVEYVKNMAVADALKSSNSDVLVEPVFEVETTGLNVKVEVRGFPANYKNFRSITPADSSWMKLNRYSLSTTAAQQDEIAPDAKKEQQRKQQRLVLGVAGGLLGVVLLVALISIL